MLSNQRARLVLHPFSLILLLVIAGLAVGGGFVFFRNRGPDVPLTSGSDQSSRSVGSHGILLSSDHLDFGDVLLDREVLRQLVLRNTGLNVVRLRLEGSPTFRVEPREISLDPGKSSHVAVVASPAQPGALRDELRIYAEGRSLDPLVVVLEGRARSSVAVSASASQPSGADQPGAERGVAASSAGETLPGGGPSPDDAPGSDAGRSASALAPGSVQVTRTSAASGGIGGDESRAALGARMQPPGAIVVPFDFSSRPSRSMADRPEPTAGGGPSGDDEDPVPVKTSKDPSDLERKKDTSRPRGASGLAVSAASTLSILGSVNQFYPQQLLVFGSPNGGTFSLGGSLQLPRIALGFGQSMTFAQSGSAVGTFDPGSGLVQLHLLIQAIDSNGRAAPLELSLTTASFPFRNNSGAYVSVSGSPRLPSGDLRLVGAAKVPTNHGNSAEEQWVTIEIVGNLSFPQPESSGTGDPSGSGGGM